MPWVVPGIAGDRFESKCRPRFQIGSWFSVYLAGKTAKGQKSKTLGSKTKFKEHQERTRMSRNNGTKGAYDNLTKEAHGFEYIKVKIIGHIRAGQDTAEIQEGNQSRKETQGGNTRMNRSFKMNQFNPIDFNPRYCRYDKGQNSRHVPRLTFMISATSKCFHVTW